MPNFSIALTGLQADTVALNTIGNNLANLNTTAFKQQTTSFEDLFYQNIGTSGSGNTLQVGVGVRASATTTDYTQGSLTTTGISPDVALNGNGFFVVRSTAVQGATQLTRTGDFQLDSKGNLITVDGQSVMGYGAVNGVVNQNAGVVPITVPVGTSSPAQVTSNFGLTSDLDSTAAVGAAYAAPVTVYDSLGVAHDATVTFTKATASTWNYSVALPAGDATGIPVNNTGTLTFNSAGTLVTPAANVAGITFPGMTDGAAALNLSWSLYSAAGVPQVTQTAGTSNTTNTTQNGYPAGAYQSFATDANGVVSATYSNGVTTDIGQIAVAVVTNADGLSVAGGNNYNVTGASGAMSIGVANVGGRGQIEGESLESSNVDISSEFSALIVAQRAFEANSKTVTTFDSVTQEAIAMVR